MSPLKPMTTISEMYDHALRYAKHKHLKPSQPVPRPTSEWPPENIEFLKGYCDWLLDGGASPEVVRRLCLSNAGHVLGLFLKPHTELDPDQDLQPAIDYIKAKRIHPDYTHICILSVERFRKFLYHQRGIEPVTVTPYQPEPHTEGLPDWIVQELKNYQLVSQRNWRPARLEQSIRRFWSGYLRLFRYLCGERGVFDLTDIKRQYLFDYIGIRLNAGYAVSGVNHDLRALQMFLNFLEQQGYRVPLSLRKIPSLKTPDPLPRYLTDEQVGLLRDEIERKVREADKPHIRRNALLDRATFYLLWQAGMRLGEVEELRLEDLELESQKLSVRQGKNLKDRTVYLTETVVEALRAYLAVRGEELSDHVFLFRNRAFRKDLVRDRIKAAGRRVGVKVQPHRLRHTCATQLLNAGCRVTSIQRFLGHKQLSTTMVYARVHDHTVAEDYYTAMEQVEQRLDLIDTIEESRTTTQAEELAAMLSSLRDADLNPTQMSTVMAVREGILAMANGKYGT